MINKPYYFISSLTFLLLMVAPSTGFTQEYLEDYQSYQPEENYLLVEGDSYEPQENVEVEELEGEALEAEEPAEEEKEVYVTDINDRLQIKDEFGLPELISTSRDKEKQRLEETIKKLGEISQRLSIEYNERKARQEAIEAILKNAKENNVTLYHRSERAAIFNNSHPNYNNQEELINESVNENIQAENEARRQMFLNQIRENNDADDVEGKRLAFEKKHYKDKKIVQKKKMLLLVLFFALLALLILALVELFKPSESTAPQSKPRSEIKNNVLRTQYSEEIIQSRITKLESPSDSTNKTKPSYNQKTIDLSLKEKILSFATGSGMLLFFGYSVLIVACGWVGLENTWGMFWGILATVLTVLFRFPLLTMVGAFLCAKNVWDWHWFWALCFVMPGLVLGLLMTALKLLVLGGSRNRY